MLTSSTRQQDCFTRKDLITVTSYHAQAVFLQVTLSKTMTVWGMWMSAKRTTGVRKTALQEAVLRTMKQSLTLNARRPENRKRVSVYFKMIAMKLFTMALKP